MGKTNSLVDEAIQIALDCFKGKVDKGGKPYMLHNLAVMYPQKTAVAQAAAVVHDCVEDGYITREEMARRLSEVASIAEVEAVMSLVSVLTHDPKESYEDYIERIFKYGGKAIEIKLADLRHNMQISRLESVEERDLKRMMKYVKAAFRLQKTQ